MKQRLVSPSARRLLARLAVSTWMLALAAGPALGQAAPPKPGGKTINDGVYASAQAERGQTVFAARCTACHDPARFTGDDFLASWHGKPLHALFELVTATMPEDNPGSLKPQQYADVIAYLLKINKFPSGQNELKGTADAMRAVRMEKKAKAPAPKAANPPTASAPRTPIG